MQAVDVKRFLMKVIGPLLDRRDLRMAKEIEIEWGARFSVDGNDITGYLPVLRSVGIRNLVDVASHEVMTIAGSTSHIVRFRDGGFTQFAYNDRGQLIELSGCHCTMTADRAGRVLVGAFGDPTTHGLPYGLSRP